MFELNESFLENMEAILVALEKADGKTERIVSKSLMNLRE